MADYLKDNADNIWFILGAYFFAFFPWMIMNDIDFISEKWRTCRRTRKLAHIYIASSIIPIIYVAVYAEAQRRDEDNKELAAALAALMFNVFQLMRSIMGLVQLNAFVAWCSHAAECLQALKGRADEENRRSSSGSMDNTERGDIKKTTRSVRQWQNVPTSFRKRGPESIRTLLERHGKDGEQCKNRYEENCEASVNVGMHGNDTDGAEEYKSEFLRISGGNRSANADSNAVVNSKSTGFTAESKEEVPNQKVEDWNEIENGVMVNNMVVDNELGGREVTVLPSWMKIWRGVKEVTFTPSDFEYSEMVWCIFMWNRWRLGC